MIKRRFYKEEHADGGSDSESSSASGSDSDSEPPPAIHGGGGGDEEVPGEEHLDEDEEEKETPLSPTSGSGYASEDSSGDEVGCDSLGLPVNEEDSFEGGVMHHKDGDTPEKIQRLSESIANKASPEDSVPDLDACVLKFKSVFKCRICPRIVCLNETTIRTHLTSKRHARSKKLLQEGRLKLTLNSDGEIEEEQETHAERHARTIALAQEADARKQKDEGQKRKRKRSKKKLRSASDKGTSKDATKKSPKKRRKTHD